MGRNEAELSTAGAYTLPKNPQSMWAMLCEMGLMPPDAGNDVRADVDTEGTSIRQA